jgi:hypothetical protein
LLCIARMSKAKETPADKRGTRTKRNPRDPGPDRQQSSEAAEADERKPSSWEPIDDLYGESDGAVDEEMEFDTGKFERPIPKS